MNSANTSIRLSIGEFKVSRSRRRLTHDGREVIRWTTKDGRHHLVAAISTAPWKTDKAIESKQEYHGDVAVWHRNKDNSKDWCLAVLDLPPLRTPWDYQDEIKQLNAWFEALEKQGVFDV